MKVYVPNKLTKKSWTGGGGNSNETKISNLLDKNFKVMAIKKFQIWEKIGGTQ